MNENFKIYHAHGYVVHSDNCGTGDEIWNRDSAFSKVFFDFERAKQYLLEQFEQRLAQIYRRDKLFENREERDIEKVSPEWRKEYIEEYIDYCLIVSELNREPSESDFSKPPVTDWYFRYTGEVRTRYFVFGDREYECRESDLLPEAGTKFLAGDFAVYNEWEFPDEYKGVLIVLHAPKKPQNKSTPWENRYEVLYIEDQNDPRGKGRVFKTDIHEADLTFCTPERLDMSVYKEPLLALQKAVKGEGVSRELREQIINGKVLFHAAPCWREFQELNQEEK